MKKLNQWIKWCQSRNEFDDFIEYDIINDDSANTDSISDNDKGNDYNANINNEDKKLNLTLE